MEPSCRRLKTVLVLGTFVFAFAARAQCTKDTDCKGDRVCQAGTCVESAPPAATDLASRPILSQPNHWARAAGWVGIGASAVVMGFGIASAATASNTTLAESSGAIALVAGAVGAPLVAVGASSARFDASITGVLPLRITGWIAYGVAMVTGAAMIVSGFFVAYPSELIFAVAGLGVVGLVCLSIDAFVSASEADDYLAAGPPRAQEPAFAPLVTLARDSRGGAAPTVGLAARF